MSRIRSLLFLITIFISFAPPTWACNSYQLNQIKLDVEQKIQLLSVRNYNYDFLSQLQQDVLNQKSFLENCFKTENANLSHIKSTLSTPNNMSSLEKQNILVIQQNTEEHINLTKYSLNQINQSLIIIHDRLNYAKDYTDYRNQFKSLLELLQEGNFIRPSFKSFGEIFPVIYDSIVEKSFTVLFHLLSILCISLITLYLTKKYTKKQLNPIRKSFYLHSRFTILMLFPFMGLFLTSHHGTDTWLIQPAGLIFLRWAIIMCFIKISSMHYLCLLSKNITIDKFNLLSNLAQKIFYSLLFVGVFQFLTINCFENGDLIELTHLLIVIPLFFCFYTYYMIQMIIELTTIEYFPSQTPLKLKTYRYLGIALLIIYMIIRQSTVYLGYQLFSTAQFTCSLIIFIYFFRYLHFIKTLKQNLNPDLKQGWVKLKSLFGVKPNENLMEFNILIGLFNIIFFYYLVIFNFYVLTIPEYYIFLLKNLIHYPILLSTLDFSPINTIKAILAFTITVLMGKFIACRITQNPKYAHDIDKRLTIDIVIHYSFYILATLISLLFIGLSAAHISVIIGSIGVGLGIGAQYIVHNMISGLIIITKKIVHVGDFISIINLSKGNDITSGKIEKISILSTEILDEDQLLINVPNSYILENCVINFTSSENVNTCYVNLKIKNIHDYHKIVTQIINLLKSYPDVIQSFPYAPSVKLLQSKTENNQEYRNINISFSVSNLSEKQFIYSQIKNKILEELKNELFSVKENKKDADDD